MKVIPANSAAESYQWVLWRQQCEQGTAERQQSLTGMGAAGNSCQSGPSKELLGCSILGRVVVGSGHSRERSTVIPAASCHPAPLNMHLGPPLRMRLCTHHKEK